MMGFGLPEIFILILIAGISSINVIPFWRIFSKAGYPGWWSLSQLIPFLNLIILFIFAFSEWPVLKKKRDGKIIPPPLA